MKTSKTRYSKFDIFSKNSERSNNALYFIVKFVIVNVHLKKTFHFSHSINAIGMSPFFSTCLIAVSASNVVGCHEHTFARIVFDRPRAAVSVETENLKKNAVVKNNNSGGVKNCSCNRDKLLTKRRCDKRWSFSTPNNPIKADFFLREQSNSLSPRAIEIQSNFVDIFFVTFTYSFFHHPLSVSNFRELTI